MKKTKEKPDSIYSSLFAKRQKDLRQGGMIAIVGGLLMLGGGVSSYQNGTSEYVSYGNTGNTHHSEEGPGNKHYLTFTIIGGCVSIAGIVLLIKGCKKKK
ncbi:MAG: hypothetical protein OEL75_01910 [Kiritimatiellaceae bacterium]|nr:hypothetical protein [Kiritimatiellaceae bacterium]